MNPANTSKAFHAGLPVYDLYVTTKSYNVAEFARQKSVRSGNRSSSGLAPVRNSPG